MSFQQSTYDPLEVQATIDGVTVDQFADGSFIEVGYSAPTNTLREGAQGDVTLIKICSTSGTAKFLLKQSSRMHSILTLANAADKITPGGVPVFAFTVMQGSTPLASASAKISMPTKRTFPGSADGKDEPVCEWSFVLTNLVITS